MKTSNNSIYDSILDIFDSQPLIWNKLLNKVINDCHSNELLNIAKKFKYTNNHDKYYFFTGLMQFNQNNIIKALENFSKCFEFNPNNKIFSTYTLLCALILKNYTYVESITNKIDFSKEDHSTLQTLLTQFQNFQNTMFVQTGQIKKESQLGNQIDATIRLLKPKVILDIGAATGLGSTTVLAESIINNNLNTIIYAIESEESTYNTLVNNIRKFTFVKPILGTLVKPNWIPSWHNVIKDINNKSPHLLKQFHEVELKKWYDYSVNQSDILSRKNLDALSQIDENIFDIVILDAGLFFAKFELQSLYNKTNCFILNDTISYKNTFNNIYLSNNFEWKKTSHSDHDRNGWSIFIRNSPLIENNTNIRTKKNISRHKQQILHFIYSGEPKNDSAIRAPQTITNKLFRFLDNKIDVRYYDWSDTHCRFKVNKNDIILGHPHPDTNSILNKMFNQECNHKFLLWPFHTYIESFNNYALKPAEIAKKLFAICGPYWIDTIDRSRFAHLKHKFIRIDNAIDCNIFPLQKKYFNKPGERGIFVIGRSGPEKGTTQLFNLLKDTDIKLIIAGNYSDDDKKILDNRKNSIFIGNIDWSDKKIRQFIINECDFFANFSISDAAPTTLLECMSLGLIPVTTPQCGYYHPSFFLLSLICHEHNAITIFNIQHCSNDQLQSMQRTNRLIIENIHTWDIFCNTIWKEIKKCFRSS